MSKSPSTLIPDPTQTDVVDCPAPNLLVTAPPGRGKTLVAIWKAKAIIDAGILHPWQKVLFLSFSRSAVAQVARAAQEALPVGYRSRIDIATYHSFFFRLIEAYGRYAGLPPKLDLLWGPECRRLCARLLREHGVAVAAGQFADVCEWFAALAPRDEGHHTGGPCEDLPQLAKAAPALAMAKESACRSTGKIHFDDFAHYAKRILTESQRICRAFGGAYPVIIADEFQDTSDEQWAILKLISEGRSLIAFADPHQLIFASFGASHARLDEFKAARNPAELTLATNYRMKPEIEQFAGHVASLVSGDLRSSRPLPDGSVVTVECKPTLQAQAYALKWPIKRELDRGHTVGVLAPTNRDVACISNCFSKKTQRTQPIQHDVMRETDNFPVAADAALALVELHTSRSRQALRRFGTLLSCLCTEAKGDCSDLLPLCAPEGDTVSPGAARKHHGPCPRRAADVWQRISSFLEQPPAALDELLRQSFGTLGDIAQSDAQVRDALADRLDRESTDLMAALSTFASSVNGEPDLGRFVEAVRGSRLRVALLEDLRPPGRVRVMTMHKSKGREFDAVFLVDISDGNFPHRTAFSNAERLRDAVNLLYVAATRAKKRLHISYQSNRPSILLAPFLK